MNNTNDKDNDNTCTTANNNGISYTDDVKPRVSETCIPELVNRLYGLKVTEITKLPSYYDINFYIATGDTHENEHVKSVNKNGYVLKILNSLASSQTDNIGSQHAVCKYLKGNDVPTQLIILNTEGKEWSLETFQDLVKGKMTQFGPYLVRLLTFIPGQIYKDTPYATGSLFNIGKFVGKVHKELKGFRHTIDEIHSNPWTFQKTSKLRDFTHVVASEANVRVVEEVVEAFEQSVLQNIDKFTEGVIHGDMSEQNIIMHDITGHVDTQLNQKIHDVSGLIDFAHVSYSCNIFDVAICIAYIGMTCPDEEQTDVGGHILAGYYQNCSLRKEELDALKILICVRLCQSLTYGMHTYLQQPENKYLLYSQKYGWSYLHKLWKMPSNQLYKRWEEIVSQY